MNFHGMTVAELRQVLQSLIREGKVTNKSARDVAFMNKDALVTSLTAYEIANGSIEKSMPSVITEPEPTEPEPTEPEPEPMVESTAKETVTVRADDSLASVLASALKDYIKPELDAQKVLEIVRKELETFDVTEKMREVESFMNNKASILERELTEKLLNLTPIKVEAPNGEVINVGIQHMMFERVLKLCAARHNVWLVGPSGSGKTHLAESIAKALSLPFEALSVGLQTSKSDLFGYTDAHGNYVQTAFYRCYSNGGVFLLDEVDNGNANVLAMINAATSNGSCGFPCGMVAKHKDFIFLAAANTFGLGANSVYVGRNQIDGATRNRFAFVAIDYDERLEDILTPNKQWLAQVRRIRRAADQLKEKVIASPRASMLGSQALEMGIPSSEVMEMYIFQGISKDVKDRILSRSL